MSDSSLDKAYERAIRASATDPTNPSNRLTDLMKQGIWKPRRTPKVKASKPPTIITCDDCLNWHRQGKHTAPAEVRKANRVARLARLAQQQGKKSMNDSASLDKAYATLIASAALG